MSDRPEKPVLASQDLWIVLIEKVPRGPLSHSDIEVLLQKAIIRRNDVAMQVASVDGTKPAGWKFIWQYSQFDRRKSESEAGAIAVPEERRAPRVQPAVPPSPTESLSEEILNISPEELILRAHPAPAEMRAAARLEAESDAAAKAAKKEDKKSSGPYSFGAPPTHHLAWTFGMGGTIALAIISFWYANPKGTFAPEKQAVAESQPQSQGNMSLSEGSPLSGGVRPRPREAASVPGAPLRQQTVPAPRINTGTPSDTNVSNEPIPEGFDDPEMLEQEAEAAAQSAIDAASQPRPPKPRTGRASAGGNGTKRQPAAEDMDSSEGFPDEANEQFDDNRD